MEEFTFMSQEINEISQALSNFQGSIKQPDLSKEVKVKTKGGYEYKFKYADLSTCVKAATPVLKENGLAVAQLISNGYLITLLTHKSGQWLRSDLEIGNYNDYQALGSAITYLKRYSYCAILGIVADSDDDANAACGNMATIKDTRKKATAKTVEEPMPIVASSPDNAIAQANAAATMDELMAVWKAHPELRKDNDFLLAMSTKKKEFV